MSEKTFKTFLEDEENKHPYMSVLQNDLGVNPKDLAREPQMASFFSLGGTIQNIGPYKIVKFNRNEDGKITHAVVKRVDVKLTDKRYLDLDGELAQTEKEAPGGEFLVPIEDLDSVLSQNFQPAPAPPGGVV
jgi:hypothetical protein